MTLTETQKRLKELEGKLSAKRGGVSYLVDPRRERDILPTGFWTLDYAWLTGGFRAGTYVEFYGKPSSGKTYMSLVLMAQAQKRWGKPVAYFDLEAAWDPARAEAIGVDLDNLMVRRPPTQEQAYDDMTMMVHEDLFGVIVVDSLAAMIPHKESHEPMVKEAVRDGDDTVNMNVALQARQNSQAMRRLTAGIKDTLVVFINQTRTNIGQQYGDATSATSGGQAIGFYDHNRIEIRRTNSKIKQKVRAWDPKTQSVKEEDHYISHLMNFHLEKSKNGYGNETHRAHLEYYYGIGGIDPLEDKITFLKIAGLMRHDGQWWSIDGVEKKLKGKQQAREYMEEHPEYVENLLDRGVPIVQRYWQGGRKILAEGKEDTDREPGS